MFALAIAVVLILLKIIWGSPLVTRVKEGFASSQSSRVLINATTQCPANSTMFMYDGQAYCCSTTINPDADTLQQTCRAPTVPTAGAPPPIFCALGPSRDGVRNCLELRSGLLQAKGQTLCPSTMPTFVQGSKESQGRCCSSAANPHMTECDDLTKPYCDITDATNIFTQTDSCQFLKAQQETTCPSGYGITTVAGQGPLAGMSLIGCSNNSTVCYPASTLTQLQSYGVDTSALPACDS